MSTPKTIALSFNNADYRRIEAVAHQHGVTTAAYMRTAILDRLEEDEDYRDAIANLTASHGATVSRTEMRRRLGMKR